MASAGMSDYEPCYCHSRVRLISPKSALEKSRQAAVKRYPLKVGQHIQIEVNNELDIDLLVAKILRTG